MQYQRSRLPDVQTVQELGRLVDDEFGKIELAASETRELELRESFVPPVRPRNGMIVYTNGTVLGLAAGLGIYARVNNAWVKL